VSKGPENTFIASIHKHLPVDLYRIKNNNQFNSGQPDCWYSGNAADLWIEYKYIPLPKRADTAVTINLSDLQKNWLRCRCTEGRQVAVIVGCKQGGVFFYGDTWDAVYTAGSFSKLIQSRKDLAEQITIKTTKG